MKMSDRPVNGFFDVIVGIITIAVTLLLLRLPNDYRDSVFVVTALFCFLLALKKFPTVWVIFLTTLPLIQLQTSLFGDPRISWTRFLLAGLILVFLFLRKPPDFWKALTKHLGFSALLLFIFANIVSGLRLLDIGAITRGVSYFEPVLTYLMTYYVCKVNTTNIKRVVRAILIGGVFVCGLGFVEYVTQQSILDILSISYTGTEDPRLYLLADRYGLGGRISSTFGQPVYAGMGFFIYAVIMSFYLIIYKPKFQSFLFVIMTFGIFLVLATSSRTPLVAIVPTLFVFIILTRNKSIILILIGLTVLILGFSYYVPGINVYLLESMSLTNQASVNIMGRIELTSNLLDIFKENPILGIGPGVSQRITTGGNENQYAVILADGGILAGFSYLLFMLGSFNLLFKMHRVSQDTKVRNFSLLSILLLTFLFAGAAFASFLGGPIISIVMAVYGIAVAGYDVGKIN